MSIPADKKDQCVYHTILAEMHRVHALLLNMQTLEATGTEVGLRDYFSREQNMCLGKLVEWKQRRSDIYREANDDFQNQILRSGA